MKNIYKKEIMIMKSSILLQNLGKNKLRNFLKKQKMKKLKKYKKIQNLVKKRKKKAKKKMFN